MNTLMLIFQLFMNMTFMLQIFPNNWKSVGAANIIPIFIGFVHRVFDHDSLANNIRQVVLSLFTVVIGAFVFWFLQFKLIVIDEEQIEIILLKK